MAATIPSWIVGLRGQCVKHVTWDDERDTLVFHCDRDRRFKAVDHRTGSRGTVNRRLRRFVQDLPVWGRPVVLSIEYCQLKIGATDRRMERLSFVEPGHGFTQRFARFVSQLARHMSIAAAANYTGLAWRTVKAMDQRALTRDLAAMDPGALTGLRVLGVDEVARAKGQDYLTIVYDLDSGDLVWVTPGRRASDLTAFFDQLDEPVAQGIEAVAMDMWKPFEQAVHNALPNAAIVFDRFHVMQQYSKVIDQVRRDEFKRAAKADKNILVGSRYLLLKNADNLSDDQTVRLDELLAANGPLNAVYALKEQLQQLWHAPASITHMGQRLDQWCELANATELAPMRGFVAMLQRHRTGICNYAEHPITTARLEGGHVAIGLIRKRARGLLDTEYFKLKIRQSAVPEPPLGLYALTG
ncbi:MAG: ISL3 family transposase [Salinisphaera sp.]|jgi:transposase|nr:ISL3 family transposase [Salinisphaera sp.]